MAHAGIGPVPELKPPSVEMLWEEHEPLGVLVRRFGFADAPAAGRWVAATVQEHWAIRIDSCERIVLSDANALAWLTTPSGRLLAKWSVALDRLPLLTEVARLTQWLDLQDLPVSAPLRSSDGRLQVEGAGVSMSLQRVIRGELLDVAQPDQVRAAGAVLARLHLALAGYPRSDQLVPPYTRPGALAARITSWLGSAGDHVPEAGRRTLRRLVADAPADPLPTQLVHGDFRSANVLCHGSSVAAVIDFEEVRLDHCVDEIARSAVMLGTRFRDWGPVSAEVRATFLAGYESVRPLTPVEESWWDILVLRYALTLVPPGDDPTGWAQSALDHAQALTPTVR